MADPPPKPPVVPNNVNLHHHSQDDLLNAREQRSHIAIIQMAPPAQAQAQQQGLSSSSSTVASSSSVKAPPPPSTRNGVRSGGGERRRPKKRHHCSVQGCTYNTGSSKDLTRHMRKHTGEKPYKCDRCSKSFTRYDKLVLHLRIHEGHKPHSCQFCSYCATDPGSLKKHLRVHTNERPYKCKICTYATKSSSQLVVHVRKHTGDSPYRCTFDKCEAAFKTPSDLTRHSRLHSGEKPFKCQKCDYRCAVKSNLKSHMNRHNSCSKTFKNQEAEDEEEIYFEDQEEEEGDMEEKPLPFQYACKFCDEKLDSIELFNLHISNFHPDHDPLKKKKVRKPDLISSTGDFRCPTCPATFVSQGSLRCHLQQHGTMTIPNKPADVDPQIYSPMPASSLSTNFNINYLNYRHKHHRAIEAVNNPPSLPSTSTQQEQQDPSPAPPPPPEPPQQEPPPPPPQQQQPDPPPSLPPPPPFVIPERSEPHYINPGRFPTGPPQIKIPKLTLPLPKPNSAPSTSYSLSEIQRMPLVHSTVITETPSSTNNAAAVAVTTNNSGEGGGGAPTLEIAAAPRANGTEPCNIIQNHHYDPTTGHMYVITYNNIREGLGDEHQVVQECSQNPISYVLNGNT